MWDEQSALLSDTNQHKDLIQESLVAENYIATHYCFQNQILFTKIQLLHKIQSNKYVSKAFELADE